MKKNKVSPLNPERKIYKNNSVIEKQEGIPFIITKGILSGRVLARGRTAKIIDGQIIFPSNLHLQSHIGEKVTVVLMWNLPEEGYNFVAYEDTVNAR